MLFSVTLDYFAEASIVTTQPSAPPTHVSILSLISTGNTSELKVSNELELIQLLKIVAEIRGEQQAAFMLENNGFFVQLMSLCANHANPAIKQGAERLYEIYLNLEPLAVCKEKIETIGLIENGIGEITDSSLAFAFVRKNSETDSYDGLLLSQQDMRAMFNADPEHTWGKCFITNGKMSKGANLSAVFKKFSLFNSAYQRTLENAGFRKWLNLICFNYINVSDEPGVLSFDYTNLINDALERFELSADEKVISNNHQLTLTKVFAPLLCTENCTQLDHFVKIDIRRISQAHCQAVLNVLNLSASSNSIKAMAFFCLSAFIAKLTCFYFLPEFCIKKAKVIVSA